MNFQENFNVLPKTGAGNTCNWWNAFVWYYKMLFYTLLHCLHAYSTDLWLSFSLKFKGHFTPVPPSRDSCSMDSNFVQKCILHACDGSLKAHKRFKHVSSVYGLSKWRTWLFDIDQHRSGETHQKVKNHEFSWLFHFRPELCAANHAETIGKHWRDIMTCF